MHRPALTTVAIGAREIGEEDARVLAAPDQVAREHLRAAEARHSRKLRTKTAGLRNKSCSTPRRELEKGRKAP